MSGRLHNSNLCGGYLGTSGAFCGELDSYSDYEKTIEHLRQVLVAVDPSKSSYWGHRGLYVDTWTINGLQVLGKDERVTFNSLEEFDTFRVSAEAKVAQGTMHA